jgi:hypothetical protein
MTRPLPSLYPYPAFWFTRPSFSDNLVPKSYRLDNRSLSDRCKEEGRVIPQLAT